jgi:hypothetical protein
MLSQQRDTLRLVAMAQTRGKPVVLGGPDVTASPHVYAAAEHLVLGEGRRPCPRSWPPGKRAASVGSSGPSDLPT